MLAAENSGNAQAIAVLGCGDAAGSREQRLEMLGAQKRLVADEQEHAPGSRCKVEQGGHAASQGAAHALRVLRVGHNGDREVGKRGAAVLRFSAYNGDDRPGSRREGQPGGPAQQRFAPVQHQLLGAPEAGGGPGGEQDRRCFLSHGGRPVLWDPELGHAL